MLIVNRRIEIPLDEFRFTYARSSGPGGQNVNKVNSKVTLHWPVTESPSLPEEVRRRLLTQNRRRVNKLGELVLHSQRHRDQERNVRDCLDKLREMVLEAATVPKHRIATRPTRSSQRRRVDEKKARSQTKDLRRRPAGED